VSDTQSTAKTQVTDERWPNLADLILVIAREIQIHGYASSEAQSLTHSEAAVMRHLQQEPSSSMAALVLSTGWLRTNLSGVLGSLEKKGLVERRTRPENRREVTVHRTEKGRRHYDVVRQEWGELVSQGGSASARDLDSALNLLADIKDRLISSRSASRNPGDSAVP
jgi:DNA-binding MarR family transcriptional regulator